MSSADYYPINPGLGASPRRVTARDVERTVEMSWVEKLALTIGVVEIPLQIDKYFMYHEQDALQGAVGGVNISITSVMLFVLYAIWLGRKATHLPQLRLPVMFGVPMVIYIGTVALSVLSAALPMLSIFDVALLCQAFLLFFYIANRVQTYDDLMFCVLVLCATLLAQSAIIFGLAALGVDDREIFIGPLVLTVWEGKRHGGTMQSPVLAGSTMALIWLPIAATALCARSRLVWTITMFTAFAGLMAILLTQTRGAILTSAVGSMIIGTGLLMRGQLPKWVILVAVLGALMSIYPLWLVYEKRIREGDGDSAIARKHLSLIALDMIAERPLFGYGAGNCHLAGKRFADQGKYRAEWYYTIHSKYLLVWVETGILGILTFMCVLGNGFRQGMLVWWGRDDRLAPIGLALSAALAGHSLHMIVDIFNSRTQVQMLWVMLGLAAATYKLSRYGAANSVPSATHGYPLRHAMPHQGFQVTGGAA